MADNVEIQGLEFQIVNDSTQTVQGLEALINTLGRLRTACGSTVTGLSGTAKSVRELKNALQGLNSGDVQQKITRIAGALNALGQVSNVKISSSVANQLTAISGAIDNLKWTDGDKLTALADGLRPLSELGKSNLTTFINQLGKLPTVIEELEKADIDKFTRQMTDLAAAMKPFADEMQKVSNGFSAFPSRIQRLITSTERYNSTVRRATTHTGLFGKALGGLKFAVVWKMVRRVGSMLGTVITKSNEYQENMNLFTASMGEYAESALEYGKTVSEVLGIDLSDWIRNQGVFNTLLTGFGNTTDRAALMSKNLTQLGYDLSSFFNISVEDSMQKLQSGISGELEPLRRLGYDLSQARLEAVALSLGIDKSVSSMNQAEKAELRYYAIMTQVTTAQGDLARTLEAPANQLRILQAQLEMAARAIGNIFIPALTAILPYAIAVVQVIREIANAIASLFGFKMTEIDYSSLTNAGLGAGDLADNLDSAANKAKKLKQYTAGFDELNVFSPDNSKDNDKDKYRGSGFDFKLPEYDFLAEAVNSKVEEIKKKLEPFVTWIKNNIKEILIIASSIATVLLGWKLTQDFMKAIKSIKSLSTMGNLMIGLTLAIAGFTLEAESIKNAIENGLNGTNFGGIVAGALVGTGATAFLGKAIGKFIATAFKDTAVASAITAGGGSISTSLIGAAIGGIIAGIPMFVYGIYDAIKEGLDWLNGLLITLGATMTGAAIGTIIGTIVGSIGGPVGAAIGALIGLAVGALTDLGIWIYQNWETVKGWFSTAGDWFDKNVIKPISNFFKDLWETVSGFFKNLWDDIVNIWDTVASWFDKNVIKPIVDIFSKATNWIGTFFKGCWIVIQAVWIIVSDWFNTNVVQPIHTKFEEVTSAISNFFSNAWEKIKEVWGTATEWIMINISNAWGKIKEVWGTVTNWFSNTVINPLVEKFTTAWNNIKSAFEKIVGGIETIAKNIFNGVISLVEGIINKVICGINSLINKFNSVVSWAAKIVGTDWEGLSTLTLVTLPRLKNGGFVDEGQLFIAREAGAEMVGAIGRKTAVANNDQIVEGITAGVTVANDGVIAAIYALINAVEDKDMSVSIGDDVIGHSYDRYNRNRGVRVNAGAFANAY